MQLKEYFNLWWRHDSPIQDFLPFTDLELVRTDFPCNPKTLYNSSRYRLHADCILEYIFHRS